MRFYAVLLATVIVFATTYAALTYAKVTTPSFPPESLSDNYHDAPAARVLRTHRTQDGEEREIRPLFVSKLVERIVSPKTGVAKKLALVEKLKVQQWLKRHKTPGYVFKKLVDKTRFSPTQSSIFTLPLSTATTTKTPQRS
ncbi:hypothetical protein JG687_00009288 [Phytophthora cactorum]|uniref:RxLR effector protein n=1 Tax=Phytophthora cactorum TaxID=29920 RepID=A0A329RMY6_9STRA|nr:hypothetical protein Pcac1_g22293 [Phytophthora cactorum]KAG2928939.1 hypothetical protein PC115_g7073 [Phytophthora cactorum]KAG2968248.1 hypothetical protein PC118_g18122 [Phytophthora cactorum]KAG2994682.1 hypothetical protein PC119_g18217 [Phytophthora cactorum]KAG4236139.1 hypothetical protein PC116_g15770 [Phytophthora cactorum]